MLINIICLFIFILQIFSSMCGNFFICFSSLSIEMQKLSKYRVCRPYTDFRFLLFSKYRIQNIRASLKTNFQHINCLGAKKESHPFPNYAKKYSLLVKTQLGTPGLHIEHPLPPPPPHTHILTRSTRSSISKAERHSTVGAPQIVKQIVLFCWIKI